MKSILWIVFTVLTSNCVTNSKLVDLTWDLGNETLFWPGVAPFRFTKQIEDDSRGYFYSAKEFCLGEHGGTHFDAPYHFNKNGWTTAQVPPDRLITNGALIDLSGVTPSRNLTRADLTKTEQIHGRFPPNTVLLVKFGFSPFWPAKKTYFRLDSDGVARFPGIESDAADWIVQNGRIVGVGVDTASVDPAGSLETHKILYNSQIYGVENVKIMEEIPVRNFTLYVFPMKIEDGSGGPVRIMASYDHK